VLDLRQGKKSRPDLGSNRAKQLIGCVEMAAGVVQDVIQG